MNGSLLRVFSLECDDKTRTTRRYISPANVLKDLYRIINCDCVTCTEIKVNGKLFDVWSDDTALLKDKPTPNLYIDDDLIIFGSVVFLTRTVLLSDWSTMKFTCFGISLNFNFPNCSNLSRSGDDFMGQYYRRATCSVVKSYLIIQRVERRSNALKRSL